METEKALKRMYGISDQQEEPKA